MVVIPYDLFIQAGKNWTEYHYPGWSHWPLIDDPKFEEFLGYDPMTTVWENRENTLVRVPDGSVHKFQLLAGPHWRTVIKMHEIRHKRTV